jgi:hypothetical protein
MFQKLVCKGGDTVKTIFNSIGNLIAIVYGIIYIPAILILLILMPIMTIADGLKIIETGYTVTGEYISVMFAVLMLIYFSLRFRYLRKIYNVFPSLFETIKFLAITNLFIAVGTEVLNWSYITLSQGRHIFGIGVFIICLVLWRIFVSVYYYRKPLVNFMPKAQEIMQNYSEKV